jgi:hypothetical protein
MSAWTDLLAWAKPDPWGNPTLSTAWAAFTCGLDLLTFLPASSWQQQVSDWLAGPTVTVNPGGADFRPSTVVLTDGHTDVVAVEGTRSIGQWYSYVTGAGMTPWLVDRGNVFRPFKALYDACAPRVLTQIDTSHAIYLTGYSLGSVIAGMLGSKLQSVGARFLQPAYLFACPVYADFPYAKTWLQAGWQFNHPLDPVPWLPTDALTPMGIDPIVIAEGTGLYSVGVPRWPYGFSPFAVQNTPLGWIAAFGQTVASTTLNGHNSYVYGRATIYGLGANEARVLAPFISLLQSLGLLDPWEQ